MQRLIDAAKAYLAVSELRRVESQTLQASLSDSNKRERLEDAIVDAEQQAADDALPIDEEWMVSEFKDIVNEDNRHLVKVVDLTNDGEINIGIGVSGCCLTAFFPYREDGHAVFPHIKNRGQLRRLIAALKGGE